MAAISLSPTSIAFGPQPSQGSAAPGTIKVFVAGDQAVTVSLSVQGPSAGAYSAGLYSSQSIPDPSAGAGELPGGKFPAPGGKTPLPGGKFPKTGSGATEEIIALGTSASLSPPGAAKNPLKTSLTYFIQVGLTVPAQPFPGEFDATLVVSWDGGSAVVPLTCSSAQFTAQVTTPQPVTLVAGADNTVDVSLSYTSIDPEPLTVAFSQPDFPITNPGMPPATPGLTIPFTQAALPPIITDGTLAQTRSLVASLTVNALPTLDTVGTGSAYFNISIPNPALYAGASQPLSFVVSPIYRKWASLASAKTANGGSVQDYLGQSTGNEADIPASQGGGKVQYFNGGMIVARQNGNVFVVYGAIYLCYQALGGLACDLGQPLQDEQEAAAGGRVSHFDAGDIYWSGGSGAHAVKGAIRARYNALGGPAGVLGYPTTSETPVMQNGKTAGAFNRFLNDGAIYWSSSTGAWEVYGTIRDAWETQYKGVGGPLGFPIAAQGAIAAVSSPAPLPATKYGTFQKGTLVWHDSGPHKGVNLVEALGVYVQRFVGRGSHTGFESIGFANIWLYVKVNIKDLATGQTLLSSQMPPGGNWGAPQSEVAATILNIPAVHGDLRLCVTFDGWDSAKSTSDQHLGTSTRIYDAQTLWGVGQFNEAWNGDFQATYDIQTHNSFDASKFRQEMWWSFDNFDTPSLSWEEFAETYSDVSISEIHWEHPFDSAFYGWVYEGLAANGNCFGMAIESVFAQVGRSLFSEPIITYKQDDAETREINIKMGYQLGSNMVTYFLDQFAAGNTHDPVNCFNSSWAQHKSGNYPVISLTTDSMFSNGHCVRPYAWFDGHYPGKPGALVILVANPNSPAVPYTKNGTNRPAVPDDDPSCMIVIDKAANTFTMRGGPGNSEIYSGGAWSGGRMFSIPFSEFCAQPQTPFWKFMELLFGGVLMIFAGDGQTTQITDGSGKTFYEPNLTAPPTKWSDIRQDTTQRIANMARVPLFGAPPVLQRAGAVDQATLSTLASRAGPIAALLPQATRPELYYRRGNGGSLRHEFVGNQAGTSQWHMRAAGMDAVVTLTAGANEVDVIEIDRTGSADATITVTAAAGGAAKQATITLVSNRSSAATQFAVSGLTLAPGQPVTFGLANDGAHLVVQNAGAAVNFQVAVQTSAVPTATTLPPVSLDAGHTAVLAPAAPVVADPIRLPVNLRVLNRASGALVREVALH